jgi:hypothetical protein
MSFWAVVSIIGAVFVYVLYLVINLAVAEEQQARVDCNKMFENLGIEPLYSDDEIKHPFRKINRREDE